MGQIYMQRRRRPDPSPEQVEEWMNDPVIETGIPFGPGGLLRAAGNIPGVIRRLFKGGKPSTEKTNVLKEVVLGDKPVKVSRRGFFSVPFQASADAKAASDILEEWLTFYDAEEWERDYDEVERQLEILGKLSHDNFETKWTPFPGTRLVRRDPHQPLTEWSSELDETKPFSPIDILGEQALKETAHEMGRTLDEEREVRRKEAEQPGVVSKAAKELRRRFGR
jgi:hypothetical protein